MKKLVLSFYLFVVLTTPVAAHPGNTASDGCHYCRTNCDKWGVSWYSRHCHNSRIIPDYNPPPSYSPPPNSYNTYDGTSYEYDYSNDSNGGDEWIYPVLIVGGIGILYYYLKDGDKDKNA